MTYNKHLKLRVDEETLERLKTLRHTMREEVGGRIGQRITVSEVVRCLIDKAWRDHAPPAEPSP